MKKHITLKINEELLKRCRYEAVESDKSLSQWVADVLSGRVKNESEYLKAKERAKRPFGSGFRLGGQTSGRSSRYET